MHRIILLIVYILCCSPALAEELDFDFMLASNQCKFLVSYNVLSDDALKVADGDNVNLKCQRESTKLNCVVSHPSEPEKIDLRQYSIATDSPPHLAFFSENGSESVVINTVENAGSYTSRMIHTSYLGHKVCHMTFLTAHQVDLLSSKEVEK